MRKLVFFILLATAAMPALAAGPNDRGSRGEARAERSERGGGENSQRPGRAARSERSEQSATQRVERSEQSRAPRAARTQQVIQSSGQSARRSSNGYSGRRNSTGSRANDGVRPAPVVARDSSAGVTNWRARERRAGRPTSPTVPTRTTSGYSGRGTNWGDRTPGRGTSTGTTRSGNWGDHNGHHWSGNWRKDHRYDWRNYRNRYSSLYRLGRYHDPFGYGYRRFSIGFSLWPSYYGNNYWLNDPWQYRLPPAYGPYRWVRYYNDALLVDIYSGEVVDVIYGFFW